MQIMKGEEYKFLNECKNLEYKRKAEQEKKLHIKSTIKKETIQALKPIVILISIICLLSIIISASLYYVNLFDTTKQEGDWSNLPYVADYSLENSKISPSGEITTGMSAQEIWETLVDNGSRIDEYLDSPEDLKKLLNVELITRYPDTRENPDEPIDWDKINNDPNSKLVQGIVKLKRKTSRNDEKSTLTYVDPETFQNYIDKYNETGLEEDKEKALSHFTLGKQEIPKSVANPEIGTDGTAKKIEKGATILIPQGKGLGETYNYLDWQSLQNTSSYQYKLKKEAGVTFDEEGFGRINGRYVVATTSTFGTIGDYIDYYLEDGSIIPCIIGELIDSTKTGVNSWGYQNGKSILQFLVDRETWTTSTYAPGGKAERMHDKPGTNGFKMEWKQKPIKVTNGGNYFENPTFASNKTLKKSIKKDKGIKLASTEEVSTKRDVLQDIESGEGFYAKIATWSEQYTTITSTDPSFDAINGKEQYMATTDVNYKDLTSGESMPLEYLLGFLFVGQEKQLVSQIADLAYKSEIEISIIDNVQEDTIVIEDTYTKKTMIETEASFSVTASNPPKKPGGLSSSTQATVNSGKLTKEISENFKTIREVKVFTHTVNAGITKANTWIKNQSSTLTPNTGEPKTQSAEATLSNMEYSEVPDKTDDIDFANLAAEYENQLRAQFSGKWQNVSITRNSIQTNYFYSYVDINRAVSASTGSTNYIMSPPIIEEKLDPNSTEPNFVTIFQDLENSGSANRIHSADKWLLDILSKNKNTTDLTELTMYLLGKISNTPIKDKFDLTFLNPDYFIPTIGETKMDTIFFQTDYGNVPYGWKKDGTRNTLLGGGCGPTCFAMAASDYLGVIITPPEAIEFCGDRFTVKGERNGIWVFSCSSRAF